MGKNSTHPVPRRPRGDHLPRRVEPHGHDTYRRRAKPSGPVACPDCGVTFRAGRWSWAEPLGAERPERCPACQRLRDGYPAGTLQLAGHGFDPYREEVRQLIANVEKREKAEHPLERLMRVEDENGGLRVETTGLHLARCLASALKRRFHGHVQIVYPKEENRVRVEWVE